ncbi:hypothetical protein CR205_11190 [Alteribacter lacisalsi]|uniref:Homeodomain phBC6A51-type domain-containing protein n=1 Tax=Alteribacter lacisalsi TaxID=2045244 RepID=A0A2W0HE00_9BACI|nr:phBC6A51 family helix-turn-helix protein [Alteribacter lacisalsi]PYZ99091.1 hypothetical protein CR205_11190 [Alteribacter lacisalsi]
MNSTAMKLLNSVDKPERLTERQAVIARKLAMSQMNENHSIEQFCKANGMSTKTLYAWKDEVPEFEHYLNQLSDAIVPEDERKAFQKIKKKIMAIADKKSPSEKEINLFLDTFSYVAEADKRERARALGIDSGNGNTGSDNMSIEDKKNVLLKRLKD